MWIYFIGITVQGYDVGVTHFQEGLFLRMEMHQLILFQNLLLAHYLECIDFTFASEFDKFDSTKGAIAKSSEYFQIITLQFPKYKITILLKCCKFILLHINNDITAYLIFLTQINQNKLTCADIIVIMFDLIYYGFFVLMLAEIVLFLLLNLKIPFIKTWKSQLFKGIVNNHTIHTILKVQLLLCIMVVFFYVDLQGSEKRYQREKNKMKQKTSMGAELQKARLSYQIIKIQRNKYVSFLVVFTFLSNVIYFWIKMKRFTLQQEYQRLSSSQDMRKLESGNLFD